MRLLIFLLFTQVALGQVTPASAIFYDDYTGEVNLGVEIDFRTGGWVLQTEAEGANVPPFSKITIGSISVSVWPERYSNGVVLVVIRVCGHSIWRKSSYITAFAQTMITPNSIPKNLKSPCNHISVEAHWQGEIGARLELSGMALIE